MEIRSLRGERLETVHAAFTEAFSDYEVPIKVTFEKFAAMVKTRDLALEYSIGCYDGGKLVSFIVCGFRVIGGRKVCYDGGTGTIKDYRRRGIGGDLLRRLIGELKEKNVGAFVLEVLENNRPAIELYKKHGFAVTRKLECYECKKCDLKASSSHDLAAAHDAGILGRIDRGGFKSYRDSWQNDDASVENSVENYSFASLSDNGAAVAYGFIHKTGGDIPQIGVAPEWRDRGVEPALVGELSKLTSGERMTVLNVEEGNYLGRKLKDAGFQNFVNQLEMMLEL